MELFAKLFSSLLVFVYHCFDRNVINGYLSGLSRPEQVVYFFRDVMGVPVVDKAVLSKRTGEYRSWVEAFARNHNIPMEWAQKGVRKENYVRTRLRRMERSGQYGVYFIFQSMEQGPTFRCSIPKFPTQDPNPRILKRQRSRFTHYYFYLRDKTLGPMVMRVAKNEVTVAVPEVRTNAVGLLHHLSNSPDPALCPQKTGRTVAGVSQVLAAAPGS
jgi:hypothetical protein